ncbi:DUF423 domain-containing protein [Methylocapsa acidiphila]|uniref:DUF423 domain-containing protein n=1 Tax=Methylocapsa acidiphila TaxID=133552 RepID=UPI001FD8A6ED|nr:DUF423 domain-containing protein [Methylocapsa acidiphila]
MSAFIAIGLAGLAGGAGVILSAVAAHGTADAPLLTTSANFLMLHAAATIAAASVALAAPQSGRPFLIAAALFLLGGLLFSGDLATRALAGARLFPMAAPIGGSSLILGWAAVAIAAIVALRAERAKTLGRVAEGK